MDVSRELLILLGLIFISIILVIVFIVDKVNLVTLNLIDLIDRVKKVETLDELALLELELTKLKVVFMTERRVTVISRLTKIIKEKEKNINKRLGISKHYD